MNGVSTESMISMLGSRTQRRSRNKVQPTASPHANSLNVMTANVPTARSSEKTPALTAAMAKRYSTNAVASLARPSPSNITKMRRGICRRRATDKGATASGGETMAPRRNPSAQGRPSSQWAAAAVAIVVNATQPIASMEMARRLNRKSRQLMATAEE